MRIISWNVNSIRSRLEHFAIVEKKYSPDIFLLQETRVSDESFPIDFFEDFNYNVRIYGQKSRNGVAILSKHILEEVNTSFCDEARYIESFTGGAFVASVYVPNGQYIDSEQYRYKLDFLSKLKNRFLNFRNDIFIAGGDFNVAPNLNDTYDKFIDGILCSPNEREAMKNIKSAGFSDILENEGYTWWDYRNMSFKKNTGMRLDHFYLSEKAKNLFSNGRVLKEIRALNKPSDHAPIICEMDL